MPIYTFFLYIIISNHLSFMNGHYKQPVTSSSATGSFEDLRKHFRTQNQLTDENFAAFAKRFNCTGVTDAEIADIQFGRRLNDSEFRTKLGLHYIYRGPEALADFNDLHHENIASLDYETAEAKIEAAYASLIKAATLQGGKSRPAGTHCPPFEPNQEESAKIAAAVHAAEDALNEFVHNSNGASKVCPDCKASVQKVVMDTGDVNSAATFINLTQTRNGPCAGSILNGGHCNDQLITLAATSTAANINMTPVARSTFVGDLLRGNKAKALSTNNTVVVSSKSTKQPAKSNVTNRLARPVITKKGEKTAPAKQPEAQPDTKTSNNSANLIATATATQVVTKASGKTAKQIAKKTSARIRRTRSGP